MDKNILLVSRFIKMEASADPNHPEYLDSLRNFILNEVEADVVCLQNKVIGQNHIVQTGYVYKAWYKANNEIRIGSNVTPKTDIGDYVTEASGDITVYAGQNISLEPGFSTEYGATFHAFIASDGCEYQQGAKRPNAENQEAENQLLEKTHYNTSRIEEASKAENTILLFPNPNQGTFTLQLPATYTNGIVSVTDMLGKEVYRATVDQQRTKFHLNVPKGVYYLHYADGVHVETKQIIIQ